MAQINIDEIINNLTVEEKIGQLVQLNGFKIYNVENGKLVLTDEFKQAYEKYKIGALYGLFRADWWTGRNFDNGIKPEMMKELKELLQSYIAESSDLKIPMIIAEEAPHGMMALGTTVFSTGLGQASTWNVELLQKMGEVVRAEAKAMGIQIVYGPVLDLAVEPRWSRVEEGYGEDPYLTSEIGVAIVKGVQQNDCSIYSTLKHFAGHGAPEGGHNSSTSHLGKRELFDSHLLPFEKCIKAGAKSVMTSYNDIDGIPCTANSELLNDILREAWGFDGFVVSDSGSVEGLMNAHWMSEDRAEITALALNAGVDMDLSCMWYGDYMKDAFDRGLITEETLNKAVRRVLKAKVDTGLFDESTVSYDPKKILGCDAHRELAYEIASESIVLLENKDKTLPLCMDKVKSIAVIGPNADTPMNQLGDYTAPQEREKIVTVLDGITARCGDRVDVKYAKGCKIRKKDRSGFAEAIDIANSSDLIVLVLGGSSSPNSNTEFLENGASRIDEVKNDSEYDKDCGEGYDRSSLRLGGYQTELLMELKKTGKKIITVLIQGRPLIINEVAELSDAVLIAWYPGMEGGNAIADVLFGRVNPSGKLPVSIPLSEGQLPVYYNSKRSRNNYIDLISEPKYSFGYGLSYTEFEYSKLKINVISKDRKNPDVAVSFEVKNVGSVKGKEVCQLYVTDDNCSVVRPYMELKGFKKVELCPGETKTVQFNLTYDELAFHNKDMEFVVEGGYFTVGIGGNTKQLIKGKFNIE